MKNLVRGVAAFGLGYVLGALGMIWFAVAAIQEEIEGSTDWSDWQDYDWNEELDDD